MTLTRVPGLRVGHATHPDGPTGCTVVLGPFRGAVHRTGTATGSRELATLEPDHVVPRVDAILFTGGSAFGLAAAEGVVRWLAERGRGYRTRVAPVPIVPAAVVYDLRPDSPRPDAALGYAAADAASDAPVETGPVGAGAGVTVGKIGGPEGAWPAGVGSAAVSSPSGVMGALTVLNAVGDVLGADGRIVAGARDAEGRFLDAARALREGAAEPPLRGGGRDLEPGTATVLSVVATDAPLGRSDLHRVARMASAAVARRISPAFTPYDGDVVVALSTAPGDPAPSDSPTVLALGAAAAEALERAILGAVEP